MTSKEALKDLRWNVSMSRDCNYKECNDLCDIIEKDLEMLYLLKENNLLKHLIDKELFDTANSYCGNTNEERERVKQYRDKLNKLKEWLEDDK